MKRLIFLLSALLFVQVIFAQDATSGMTIAECRVVLSNCPDCSKVAVIMGCLYGREGDVTNAEKAFLRALKVDRTSSEAYYNLGVLKLNGGRYNEAVENFIRAAIFKTNDAGSYLNLGNIYNIRNDLGLAIYYYQKALAFTPDDADLLNDLGVAYLKQKLYIKALETLKRAYDARQDDDIKLNLAIAWHQNGNIDKVRELYPYISPEDRNYPVVIRLLEGR